jgi:GR25 family glycosyltransferase involved in LPS biosynthesis
MGKLNEYFDKIYCINLDRRPDRWENISKLFEKEGIIVDRFSAIDKKNIKHDKPISDGQVACLLSHYNILSHSLNEGYKKILIFEDDAVFDEGLVDFFDANIDKVPEDWGFLYLGGNHLNGLVDVEENVYKMRSSLATHAYAVKIETIPHILENIKDVGAPIDIYYAALHRILPSYVMKNGDKSLVWQKDDYSDVDDAECDYTWLK